MEKKNISRKSEYNLVVITIISLSVTLACKRPADFGGGDYLINPITAKLQNYNYFRNTSCARGDKICPRPLYAGRCGPAAAHPLRLRRPVAAVAINIHDVHDRHQTDVIRRASSLNAPYP